MKYIHHGEAPVPETLQEAATALRVLLKHRDRLAAVDHEEFLAGWAGIAFIAPGLHPDEVDNPTGGWPRGWKSIANEAFSRAERGELADGELYPYRAGMAGLGVTLEE